MNSTQHRRRHKLLKEHLDELYEDYRHHTGRNYNSSILDLLGFASIHAKESVTAGQENPHPTPRERKTDGTSSTSTKER